MQSVKYDAIHEDRKVVDDFIKHIISKLSSDIKEQLELIMEKGQLGFNHKTGRIGVLFPEHMVDFRVVFKSA